MTKSGLKISLFALMVSLATPVFADVPVPETSGYNAPGKGTKAAESYQQEGRAGGPVYEYGHGFQIGALHIKPNAEYTREWGNNIFYEENGRQEDWSHNLTTDFTAELPLNGGQHLFSASYLAAMEWFDRFDDQDHTDHNVGLSTNLNFVPFSLSVDHTFKRTVDRANTEFTNRVSRKEHLTHGLLEIPFSSFFLETEAFNLNVDYRLPEDSRFDHNGFKVYQRVGYDIAPSTQLLLEYGYDNISYEEVDDRDGDGHAGSVGFRGNLSPRIGYQAWVGYEGLVYDEDTRPDFYGVIARGAVQYELSQSSYIALKGDRAPQESTFDNQSYYTRNRLELLWKQQIRERLFFNTREMAQYNEYSRITTRAGDQETRRDWVWQTGVGLEYMLPNELVSIFGEFRFNARDTNMTGLDYDADTVSFGVRSSF